jgi:hypothetical protein
MFLGTFRRLTSRPLSSGFALILITACSPAAMAQSSSRPPAGQPTSTPPAIPSAGADTARAGEPASRPSMKSGSGGGVNPGANSGGSGYNPGSNSGGSGGSGYNPGANSGGSGYNPGSNSGGSGGSGYNPGANSGGSGYNPGSNSGGSNSGGAWNGVTGDGWNPGNYYQQSVIKGWMRLGSAAAGKNADRDTIQAFGRYRYSRIKLCVRVADVAFYDAQVQFESGGRQDVKVQSRVKRGQCTQEYYLRGGKSLDIRFVYLYFRQSDDILNWRTAQVDLYAR